MVKPIKFHRVSGPAAPIGGKALPAGTGERKSFLPPEALAEILSGSQSPLPGGSVGPAELVLSVEPWDAVQRVLGISREPVFPGKDAARTSAAEVADRVPADQDLKRMPFYPEVAPAPEELARFLETIQPLSWRYPDRQEFFRMIITGDQYEIYKEENARPVLNMVKRKIGEAEAQKALTEKAATVMREVITGSRMCRFLAPSGSFKSQLAHDDGWDRLFFLTTLKDWPTLKRVQVEKSQNIFFVSGEALECLLGSLAVEFLLRQIARNCGVEFSPHQAEQVFPENYRPGEPRLSDIITPDFSSRFVPRELAEALFSLPEEIGFFLEGAELTEQVRERQKKLSCNIFCWARKMSEMETPLAQRFNRLVRLTLEGKLEENPGARPKLVISDIAVVLQYMGVIENIQRNLLEKMRLTLFNQDFSTFERLFIIYNRFSTLGLYRNDPRSRRLEWLDLVEDFPNQRLRKVLKNCWEGLFKKPEVDASLIENLPDTVASRREKRQANLELYRAFLRHQIDWVAQETNLAEEELKELLKTYDQMIADMEIEAREIVEPRKSRGRILRKNCLASEAKLLEEKLLPGIRFEGVRSLLQRLRTLLKLIKIVEADGEIDLVLPAPVGCQDLAASFVLLNLEAELAKENPNWEKVQEILEKNRRAAEALLMELIQKQMVSLLEDFEKYRPKAKELLRIAVSLGMSQLIVEGATVSQHYKAI